MILYFKYCLCSVQVSVLTPVSVEKQTPKFEKEDPILPLPGPALFFCCWVGFFF